MFTLCFVFFKVSTVAVLRSSMLSATTLMSVAVAAVAVAGAHSSVKIMLMKVRRRFFIGVAFMDVLQVQTYQNKC